MDDLNEKINELNNTKDCTSEFDPKDIEANKVMAILAYLSWLVLVPIFGAKESKFAKFHVNQGIVLAIAEIIAWVLFGILRRIPFIGWIFLLLESLLSLVCLVISIIGILNAANGKAKELPIVGKIRLIK